MDDFDKLENYLKALYDLPKTHAEDRVYALLYLSIKTLGSFFKENNTNFDIMSLKVVNGEFDYELRHSKTGFKADIDSINFESKNKACMFVYKPDRDNQSEKNYNYVSSQVYSYEKLLRMKAILNEYKADFQKYTKISNNIEFMNSKTDYICFFAFPGGHEMKDCNIKNNILDDRHAKKYNQFVGNFHLNMEKLILVHDIKNMGKPSIKSFKV